MLKEHETIKHELSLLINGKRLNPGGLESNLYELKYDDIVVSTINIDTAVPPIFLFLLRNSALTSLAKATQLSYITM